MDTLLDILNNIRLATMLEESTTPGPAKTTYKLELLDKQQEELVHLPDDLFILPFVCKILYTTIDQNRA